MSNASLSVDFVKGSTRRTTLDAQSAFVHSPPACTRSCANVGVAQQLVLYFHVHSELPKHRRVGMAERVPADFRTHLSSLCSRLIRIASILHERNGSSAVWSTRKIPIAISPNCDFRCQLSRTSASAGSSGSSGSEYFVFTSPMTPSMTTYGCTGSVRHDASLPI